MILPLTDVKIEDIEIAKCKGKVLVVNAFARRSTHHSIWKKLNFIALVKPDKAYQRI
jgi:hypothetical protein